MCTTSTYVHGTPWLDDGNIIILSGDGKTAFKTYAGILAHGSAWFEEQLGELSNDSTEVADNCSFIQMDREVSARDLSHFLNALHHGITSTSLDTEFDFGSLTGTLRLATRYRASTLRTQALTNFQRHYPTTLPAFDLASTSPPSRPRDPLLVINLAHETSALSLLPAAMALLTNDTSASDAFSARLHPNTPARDPHHALNPTDALAFGLMKELHQRSTAALLKLIRGVAAGCRHPPESTRCTRAAPVGSIPPRSTEGPSVCSKTLNRMADDFAIQYSESENPGGFLDFVAYLRSGMTTHKSLICRKCWQSLETGLEEKRMVWWSALPLALGFSRWEDDDLHD